MESMQSKQSEEKLDQMMVGSWTLSTRVAPKWSDGIDLEGFFGGEQYFVLHSHDGVLRLVPNPNHAWGTAVRLLPAYWGQHRFTPPGTPIDQEKAKKPIYRTAGDLVFERPEIEGTALKIPFKNTAGDSEIDVTGTILISPPTQNSISVEVSVQVQPVPGEENSFANFLFKDGYEEQRFKLVQLSTMHVSDTIWDAGASFVGENVYDIPERDFLLWPPQEHSVFGLKGGQSSHQNEGRPSPTVQVTFPVPRTITGWVFPSEKPDGENVTMWAASAQMLSSWKYQVVAMKEVPPPPPPEPEPRGFIQTVKEFFTGG